MDLSRLSPLPFALCLLLAGTACVSQAEHDEALANLKYYQRNLQDLESYVGTLEAKVAELEGMKGVQPASLNADIDERIAELSRIMSGLGTAPGDVTVLEIEGGYGLRMPDAILFDSGSSELKDSGRALLLKMAKEIQTRPFQRIWVRGHTDSDPVVKAETKKRFPLGNLELSSERAIAVASLLSGEGGIGTERMVVAGFGPSMPVAPNTAAEKAKNRRVELFVIEDSSRDE